MGKRLEQALAEADDIEAAEFTADPDAPIPAHVTVTRPNRARSKVLQVRLNPDEMEAVERIAAQRDLPPSTVARDWLLRMVRENEAQAGSATATALIEQVLSAASQLRDLQVSGGGPADCQRHTIPSS